MPEPTDYLRSTIGQQARSGRARLRAGTNGKFSVDTKERGTVEFDGNVYARREDNGEVIKVDSLKDLPMGAEILLTDPQGAAISYGTMTMDGEVALYGDKPSIGDDVKSEISRMTSEIPRALSTTIGMVADAAGDKETADKTLEWSRQAGEKIEQDRYRDNPAGAMADITGSRGGARTMLNLAAGSTPFLATFGAATKLGQLVGKTLGLPFLRKPEVIQKFGSVGGLLAAMKTNAALNAGFVANDIQQALEELGVPPEQQRQAMQDGALIPGLVSSLTAIAAANNFLGAGRSLQGQSVVEGGTEMLEELSQAEAVKQYGHQPYNLTDVALQSFGAGYLSQMGMGAVGEALRPVAKYPQLRRLRKEMAKLQNFAQSVGGLKLSEQYQADKEFFKALRELNKWSGRLGEVGRMSQQELRTNFGRFFPGFEGQEEDMRTAVKQAAQAFGEAIQAYGKPIDAVGNAERVLKLAMSDDMGSDEARMFLDKAANTLGASPEATMDDKANLVSNYMGNVDTVWRDWRVTEAYRAAFGDILPQKPGHSEEAREAIQKADIEQVLDRAPRFAVEYKKLMGKQNIVPETDGKIMSTLLEKKPLHALIGMGLIDNEKASQKVINEPAFAKKVADSESNTKVSQAYERMAKKARVRPKTLKLNLKRAAAQDEKDTAEQAKANEGAENPKPVVPSTAAREKAYADAMKEFLKDLQEREQAATDILHWIHEIFPDDAFADVAAQIRFHIRGEGKADPDDAAEVMGILANGISEGFIDMPYGDALPEPIEQKLAELVESLQAEKAAQEAAAQEEEAQQTPPSPPSPTPAEGETTGEGKPEEKEETEEQGETDEEKEGGTKEDEVVKEPKEEPKEPKEPPKPPPEKTAAADDTIRKIYDGGKVEEEALTNMREVMGGWDMVDKDGKTLLQLKAAALWLAYLSSGVNDVNPEGGDNFDRFIDIMEKDLSLGMPANFDHKQVLDQLVRGGLVDSYEHNGEKMYGYPLNEDKSDFAERAKEWIPIRNRIFAEKEGEEGGDSGGGEPPSADKKGFFAAAKNFFSRLADARSVGGSGISPTTMNAFDKPKKITCV